MRFSVFSKSISLSIAYTHVRCVSSSENYSKSDGARGARLRTRRQDACTDPTTWLEGARRARLPRAAAQPLPKVRDIEHVAPRRNDMSPRHSDLLWPTGRRLPDVETPTRDLAQMNPPDGPPAFDDLIPAALTTVEDSD